MYEYLNYCSVKTFNCLRAINYCRPVANDIYIKVNDLFKQFMKQNV